VTPDPGRRTPVWIKVLVYFHILCVVIWTLPVRNELTKPNVRPIGTDWLLAMNLRHVRTQPWVKAYLFGTGTWQYWDMFAPNPANSDGYGDALVKFKNGKERTYWYPRIRDVPIPGKLPLERFRKFFERAGDENTAYLWLPFARVVARDMNKDPNNPPVLVILRSHRQPIAAPGKPQQTEYTVKEYFRYVVEPWMLKEGA
jgi:hypothetical protein